MKKPLSFQQLRKLRLIEHHLQTAPEGKNKAMYALGKLGGRPRKTLNSPTATTTRQPPKPTTGPTYSPDDPRQAKNINVQTTSPVMKKSPIKKPIKAKPVGSSSRKAAANVSRDWSFARGGAI